MAKNPDRLREMMSDPQQVQELLRLMDSDVVRDYITDPTHIAELMSEVNPEQIRQAMQSVDPSIMRKAALMRYLERLRQQLGATEEEWKVLGPRVEKLIAAQQEARAGVRGIGGGRGAFGGPGFGRGANAGEPSAVQEAAAALREATRDPDIAARDTAIALRDYRAARDTARKRATEVEQELREFLTQRQEAILMMNGLLE